MVMKGLAITSKGIEDTACTEIKELIGCPCTADDTACIFDFVDFEDLCLLCYKAQSVDRVLYLIGSFDFKDFFKEFESFLDRIDFSYWLGKYKKIKVECQREGSHNFKSVDVEESASKKLIKKYKVKVQFKEHELALFFYIIGNKCFCGIDFAGFELNKRPYKIFMHPGSLRGTIGYAIVRESGFRKNEILLDPFSRDGVIAIEAALYASGFPLNYFRKNKFAFLKLELEIDYDKFFKKADGKIKKLKSRINCYDNLFKFVDYCRKNAKIAGVEKEMNFSRTEIEWLDIKFKKSSIDHIVSCPPFPKEGTEKIYNEFFYQASYIIDEKGSVSIITQSPDFVKKFAEKHGLKISKEKVVLSGEQKLVFLSFNK